MSFPMALAVSGVSVFVGFLSGEESETGVSCSPELEPPAEEGEMLQEAAVLTLLFLQVCLIGRSRTYPPAGEASVDERRRRYIHSRRGRGPAPPPPGATGAPCPEGGQGLDPGPGRPGPGVRAEGLWLCGFQPREQVERVRNCARLPRAFIDQVVLRVAGVLLGRKQSEPSSSQSRDAEAWNGGGKYGPGCLLGLGSHPALLGGTETRVVAFQDSEALRQLVGRLFRVGPLTKHTGLGLPQRRKLRSR